MARQRPAHAGRLRDAVRVERPVSVRDPGGQPVKTWVAAAEVRACVEPAGTREDWAGGRGARAEASEVVTVRHDPRVLDAGPELRLVVLTQGYRVLQAVGVERGESPVWLTVPCKATGETAAAAPWTPASLTGCVLAHLFASATMYAADTGTAAAGVGGPVGRFVAAAGPDAVQATAGRRPLRQADGLSPDGTDDRLDLEDAVTLAGDFTLYLTGTVAGRPWLPLAQSGTTDDFACVNAFDDGNLYVFGSAGGDFASTPWARTGPVLVRVRRSGGAVRVAATGLAEVTLTKPAGTLTVNCVGARPQFSQFDGHAGNRLADRLIYSRDLVADGGGKDDARVRGYLKAAGYEL